MMEQQPSFSEEYWPIVKAELEAMGAASFAENHTGFGKFAYSLDTNTIDLLDEAGLFHTTGCRVNGELVGYISSIIQERHLMYDEKNAQHLIFYLKPEYRQGWTAINMMRANEAHLKNLGVKCIYGGYTSVNDLSPIFKRLGWNMLETACTKVLE